MDTTIMAELDAVLEATHGTGSTRALPPLNRSLDVEEQRERADTTTAIV
jgi:hypothetical protein